ncbi:MAG: hypothetical protein ACJ768_08655 [Gaiellaceae bacterium]
MRFPDFLRTAVLLFLGAATVLALVALVGAKAKDDNTLVYIALGWWALAAIAGLWLGRRREASEPVARLMSNARNTAALPEQEPGAIMFNRLWSVALFLVVAGGPAFVLPQIAAIAAGYPIFIAMWLRKQSLAVAAVEERDGVRYYVDRVSPFKATRLVRTPGFRKTEPSPRDTIHDIHVR